MALSDERRGEIAYALFLYRMKQDGIRPLEQNDFHRKVGHLSKVTGVDRNELTVFLREAMETLIVDLFVNYPPTADH